MDSAQWDERYAAAELVWSAEPNRWVAAELAGLPPGRALDLAAGEARNSIWLASLGWTVLATDFSAVGLAKGRRLAEAAGDGPAARLSWLTVDLTEYQPEQHCYQLVLSCYLQVAADTRALINRRAASALAPGGVLLVIGHHSDNLAAGVGGPQDPAVLFSPDDVLADLAAGGGSLRIDKAESVLRPVPGADRPAIDALVRVTRLD